MANKRIKKKQQKMAEYFHNCLVDNEVSIFNGKRLRNYVLCIAKYYSTYGFSGSLSFQSIGLIKDSTRYAIVSIPNKESENMSFGIFPWKNFISAIYSDEDIQLGYRLYPDAGKKARWNIIS